MRAAIRFTLPLAGAVLGIVAATAFQPGSVSRPPLSPCGAEEVTVRVSPLYDRQRAGAPSPVAAVQALLALDTTAGVDVGSTELVGAGAHVRLLVGDTQVGLATTWELPAGGHAVDALALCQPGGPR